MRNATVWIPAALVLLLVPTGEGSGRLSAQVRAVDDSVYLNFDRVPIAAALEAMSQVLGINYMLGGDAAGSVTMRTQTGIPRGQMPAVLEAVLRAQGLLIERVGEMHVVVPAAGTEGQAVLPRREIFVYFLKNANTVEVANLLVTLFGGASDRFERRRRIADGALSEELRGLQLPPGMIGPVERDAVVPARRVAPGAAATGELIGGITVVPDERTNALVIRTAPENFESLQRTIEALDVRPLQVLIEVVVAEVTLDDRTQFGINFATFFSEGGVDFDIENFNPANLPPDSTGLTVSAFDPTRVRAVFRALAADNRLNVISTPRILASNNEEARILIGSEVPFVQVSSFGGIGNTVLQSVQFRDVGLQLTVVPRINQEREVTLEIRQQNSSLSSTSFGNIDAPIITTREAETSLIVGDARTVVIGGLIESQRQRQESGIPLLKDIPLLGLLFKSVDMATMKRELIITLTPYIVASDEEAETLRQRLEEARRPGQEDPGRDR